MEQNNTNLNESGERNLYQGDHGLVQEDSKVLEKGKTKLQEIKEDLPGRAKNTANSTVNWMRENPYKTTNIGLLGILSLRSKFARQIGTTIITTAATMFLNEKFVKKPE